MTFGVQYQRSIVFEGYALLLSTRQQVCSSKASSAYLVNTGSVNIYYSDDVSSIITVQCMLEIGFEIIDVLIV